MLLKQLGLLLDSSLFRVFGLCCAGARCSGRSMAKRAGKVGTMVLLLAGLWLGLAGSRWALALTVASRAGARKRLHAGALKLKAGDFLSPWRFRCTRVLGSCPGAVSNLSDGLFSVSLCLFVPAKAEASTVIPATCVLHADCTPHALTAASTCQASSNEGVERAATEARLGSLCSRRFGLGSSAWLLQGQSRIGSGGLSVRARRLFRL